MDGAAAGLVASGGGRKSMSEGTATTDRVCAALTHPWQPLHPSPRPRLGDPQGYFGRGGTAQTKRGRCESTDDPNFFSRKLI